MQPVSGLVEDENNMLDRIPVSAVLDAHCRLYIIRNKFCPLLLSSPGSGTNSNPIKKHNHSCARPSPSSKQEANIINHHSEYLVHLPGSS